MAVGNGPEHQASPSRADKPAQDVSGPDGKKDLLLQPERFYGARGRTQAVYFFIFFPVADMVISDFSSIIWGIL